MAKRPGLGEEERPPIIVRGGSLVVESGDPKKKIKGKKWKDELDGYTWKSDQAGGGNVAVFEVTIETNDEQSHSAGTAKQILITYVIKDEPDPLFLIVGRLVGKTKAEPLVTSSMALSPYKPEAEQPSLIFDAPGQLLSATVGKTVYYGPTRIIMQPKALGFPLRRPQRKKR